MTTGFGNEQAQAAVRRTLKGGSSGRIGVLVIVAAFLALGLYSGNLLISVPFGIATAAAAVVQARALRRNRTVRHLEDTPSQHDDSS